MEETFYIKRLYAGSQECATLDHRSFEVIYCVGDTDAFSLEASDVNNFPPLVESAHAPMLDTRIAVKYGEHKVMPPAAHMLYVCLRCAEADLSNYKLYIAPQVIRDGSVDAPESKEDDPVKAEFVQEHSDIEKYLAETFELVSFEPYTLEFDKSRKTPEVTNPDEEEDKEQGLYYIRLLLLMGDDPRAEDLAFRDTVIMDLTDDSPNGFPAYLKLWVSKNTESANVKAMRAESEKNLLLVETLPDDAIEDPSNRDVLEELGKMDDEDYEQIEG